MGNVFLKLLNMSIAAGWMILAVMLLRVLLKRAPKWVRGVLWAFVAVRLVCPFSFESVLSLIPSAETFTPVSSFGRPYAVDSGISLLDNRVNDYLGERYYEGVSVPADHAETVLAVLSIVWIVGVLVLLSYAAFSTFRLRGKCKTSMLLWENIWICDDISSPFILGIFRPRIYLPSSLSEERTEYVLSHERAHLKRRDHFWKPFGFLLLSVYWFNPLCWVAYWLLCRDIELACDEKVIKELDFEDKKAYSEALLSCSVSRRAITACPLAFGEVGVKERVKDVLNYKKPAFWVLLAAVASCVVTAVCLLTNPAGVKIADFTAEGDMKAVFSDVSRIDVRVDGFVVTVDGTEKVGTLADAVGNVKISRREISQNRNENRDSFYALSLYDAQGGATHLCFSADRKAVWFDDGVKPTLSYKVLNLKAVKKIFEDFPGLSGKQYRGSALAFDCGIYSFSPSPETVQYAVSDDMVLMDNQQRENSAWREIGQLTECRLAEENFDRLLEVSPLWTDGYSAKMLREENKQAWQVKEEREEDGLTVVHTVLLQKNGDVYFCVGYEGAESKHIRWIFKTESVESVSYIGGADSPESVTVSPSEDKGTVYLFVGSGNFYPPRLVLQEDRSFQFCWSAFSSYLAFGSYEERDGALICRTGDGQYTFTFRQENKTLVFDADASSPIPKYQLSGDSYEASSPVPDGAVFLPAKEAWDE